MLENCPWVLVHQNPQHCHEGQGNLLLHPHQLALDPSQQALPVAGAGCKAGHQQLDAQQDCCYVRC